MECERISVLPVLCRSGKGNLAQLGMFSMCTACSTSGYPPSHCKMIQYVRQAPSKLDESSSPLALRPGPQGDGFNKLEFSREPVPIDALHVSPVLGEEGVQLLFQYSTLFYRQRPRRAHRSLSLSMYTGSICSSIRS